MYFKNTFLDKCNKNQRQFWFLLKQKLSLWDYVSTSQERSLKNTAPYPVPDLEKCQKMTKKVNTSKKSAIRASKIKSSRNCVA